MTFDPYYKWLGIKPKDQPPNHYRLLGLDLLEDDPDVIDAAAEQRSNHVRNLAIGPHSDLSQKLLTEITQARNCLQDPIRKREYDASLSVESPTQVELGSDPPTISPVNPRKRARSRKKLKHLPLVFAAAVAICVAAIAITVPWKSERSVDKTVTKKRPKSRPKVLSQPTAEQKDGSKQAIRSKTREASKRDSVDPTGLESRGSISDAQTALVEVRHTLIATEDTYVSTHWGGPRPKNAIDMNFGKNTVLIVGRHSSGYYQRDVFLLFDLSGVSGKVKGAFLRLKSKSVTAIRLAIHNVPNPTWDETKVTWRSKPASSPSIRTWSAVDNRLDPIDVTEIVRGATNGRVSFRITTLSANGNVWYHSREAEMPSDRPMLEVVAVKAQE